MSQAMLPMRLVTGSRSGKLVRHNEVWPSCPTSLVYLTHTMSESNSFIDSSFIFIREEKGSSAAMIRATDKSSYSTFPSSTSTPASPIGSNSSAFRALEVRDHPFRFSIASGPTSSHRITLFGSSPSYAHEWFHCTTTRIRTQERHAVGGYGSVCNFRGVDLSEIWKTCVCWKSHLQTAPDVPQPCQRRPHHVPCRRKDSINCWTTVFRLPGHRNTSRGFWGLIFGALYRFRSSCHILLTLITSSFPHYLGGSKIRRPVLFFFWFINSCMR